MIEPLRQVIEQIEQLDPLAQEEVADLLQYKLSELKKRAKRQEALERMTPAPSHALGVAR